MLFFPRETFPTDRVRLITLFGRELLGRGHEIDLVMQARDEDAPVGRQPWFGRAVQVGATDMRQGWARSVRRIWRGLAHDFRHLMAARADQYDCVLVSDKYLTGAMASVIARRRGLAFFFWMTYPYHDAQLTLAREGLTRGRVLAWMRGHSTRWLLFKWILPRSDHVFVQSDKMAKDFAASGVAPSRMSSVITGIDLDGVQPIEGIRRRKVTDPLTIGYLGTLVRQRRLDVLVEMLDELRRRRIHARLLLIGDGASPDDRRCIEERARALGLESQVVITGFLSRRAALELIRTADVCVSPFRPSPALEVASPTKLIEYLALGLPVVANRHPDQSDVLRHSRAGVCVPWGARHFARGVHWLASRSDDELAAMASRGKSWVASNRSYASIADTFEKSCFQALGQYKSKGLGDAGPRPKTT